MSSLHKDFEHSLERVNVYLNGQFNAYQNNTSVKELLYKKVLDYGKDPNNFSLAVKKNVGRFDVPKVVQMDQAGHQDYFDVVPKLGDKFGPSYDTHMFKVELKIPQEWL